MPPKPKIAAKSNTDSKSNVKINDLILKDNIIEDEEQDNTLLSDIRPPERQKGGFFAFIKRLFSRNRSAEEPKPAQEENALPGNAGEEKEADEEIDGNDVNGINERDENDDEITEAAVGGRSGAWSAKENPADYITQLPEQGSFLRGFEAPYNEPVNRAPVFESSAFFRGYGMHSYMGLRYSRLDPDTGFVTRKRIGVGFGSGRGPANYGKINNEQWNLTDGSSETPITVQGLENTIRAIENTQSNIEAAKRMNPIWRFFAKAQVNPDGFSGKYNLLTYNCNDFVIFMAKKAGAELPAQFHDSILGPMVAYKNLRLAAEKGEMTNGTRIFFANALQDKITDTTGKKGQLLFDFYSRAQLGAVKDGIDLKKFPEFDNLLSAVHKDAITLFNYCLVKEKVQGIVDPAKLPQNLDEIIAKMNTTIRKAVEYNTGKKHPKITRYLLQVEAIAREFITKAPAGEKGIDDYTEYEVDYATSKLSEAEATAKSSGAASISDSVLFGDNNTDTRNVIAIGNLILTALGLGSYIKVQQGGLTNVRRTNRLLNLLSSSTRKNNAESVLPYIRRYIDNRKFLTNEQIGKLLLNGMLHGLGEGMMASRYQIIWRFEPSMQDYEKKIQKIRDVYLNARESGALNKEMRQQNLDLVDIILGNLKDIVRQARVENQIQEAEQNAAQGAGSE